jgi:CMP-N-acetylneuraminic acid synthetase
MYSLSQDDRLESLILFDEAPCRQLLPPAYLLNGALYLASRDFLLRERSFIGDDTVGYVMPAERSVDIDTPLDWKWAELLMEQQA